MKFKDLNDPAYWNRFGDLGANIGKAFMPSPREAADTVLRLLAESAKESQRAQKAEERADRLKAQLEAFLLAVANQADSVRFAASADDTSATVAKVATAAVFGATKPAGDAP